MLQHARDHGHHFRLEDQTILSYESDWVKRGIKEALFIRALNPAINIDPGRHQLSAHFDSILANHIKAPPPPPPHNPRSKLQSTRHLGARADHAGKTPTLTQPPPKAPANPFNLGWSKANRSRNSSSIRSLIVLFLRDNRSELGIDSFNLNNDN